MRQTTGAAMCCPMQLEVAAAREGHLCLGRCLTASADRGIIPPSQGIQ